MTNFKISTEEVIIERGEKELDFESHALEGYELSSFTYIDKRPFHPVRLMNFLQNFPREILRSKGVFWIASKPNTINTWVQIERKLNIGIQGIWLASIPYERWNLEANEITSVENTCDKTFGLFGDRAQKLVFVGKNLEEIKWRRKLDDLLLHDEELALGNDYWINFYNDPFKEYIPNK